MQRGPGCACSENLGVRGRRQWPEETRRACVGELQCERGGVQVLIVELHASETPLERERRLTGARLWPAQVLQPEEGDHRFHDDDRRDVLTKARMASPAVLQVMFAG